MSSSGTVYGSAKAAIIALKRQGGQEEVVQAILMLPFARGWSTRNLPLGWMIKGTPSKYNIIGPDGSFFESKAKAVDHLTLLGGSEEDKTLLDKFTEGGKTRKSVKIKEHLKFTDNFTENNKTMTLLEEYSKHVNKREKLKTVTDRKKRNSLKELIRSGASEKKIVLLRSLLMTSGWKMEGLPSGWMGKSLSHFGYR